LTAEGVIGMSRRELALLDAQRLGVCAGQPSK